jgi:hypothetical protein
MKLPTFRSSLLVIAGTSSIVAGCSSDDAAATSAGDAAADGSIGTGTSTDGSTLAERASSSSSCALAPTDAGTCNEVTQRSSLVTSTCATGPIAPATGGTVEDGVYVLDSLVFASDACPMVPDVERITWVVCGSEWELAEDIVTPDGGVQSIHLNLNRVMQDNKLTSNITCRPGSKPSMAQPQAYTAKPGGFEVQIDTGQGTRVDSFRKL